MSTPSPIRPSFWGFTSMLVLIVLAGLLGQWLAVRILPDPVIVLLDVYGTIDPYYNLNYQYRFDYINAHPEVAGVVVLINSPGGESSFSEDLYYQFARLRERMPVVASITQLGASGAYYAAMGANYVMTKPGALVGSVGVVSNFAPPIEIDNQMLTTGPYKAGGYSEAQFKRSVEEVKEYFAGVVYTERLQAWARWHPDAGPFPQTQDSLATGRIWSGAAALEAGMVDGFGSTTDAVRMVAEMAGLQTYRVQHLSLPFMQAQGYPVTFAPDDAYPSIDAMLTRIAEHPGYWYIYLPPVE